MIQRLIVSLSYILYSGFDKYLILCNDSTAEFIMIPEKLSSSNAILVDHSTNLLKYLIQENSRGLLGCVCVCMCECVCVSVVFIIIIMLFVH